MPLWMVKVGGGNSVYFLKNKIYIIKEIKNLWKK